MPFTLSRAIIKRARAIEQLLCLDQLKEEINHVNEIINNHKDLFRLSDES